MYKILFVFSLFLFQSVWAYVPEGPTHLVDVRPSSPVLELAGPEQSEVFIQVAGPGQMPWKKIELFEGPGQGALGIRGPGQQDWYIESVDANGEADIHVQVTDGKPSGPMGIESADDSSDWFVHASQKAPTHAIIEVAISWPGGEETVIHLSKGPEQSEWFIESVNGRDWPGDLGPKQSVDWPVHVAQKGPTVLIQLADIVPSNPMAGPNFM